MKENTNYPLENEHFNTPLPSADNLPIARFSYTPQPLLLSDFFHEPETPGDDFADFMTHDSMLRESCKTTKMFYSVHDENGVLVGLEARPHICASPFCNKCKAQRQERQALRYAPYLDDEIYPFQQLRHVITTTSTFPRSELPQRIDELLLNSTRFHEKLRKSYGYPLNALLVHELKYDKGADTYYFHTHYGILNAHFNIARFRKLYQDTWKQGLIVKYPIDKHGNKKPFTNKWAWLEYATRRRIETPLNMPPADYYHFVRNKQLFKRIGFTKATSRILTTIRKNYGRDRDLPDGWTRVYLGTYPGSMVESFLNGRFGERFRRIYEDFRAEKEDLLTCKSMARITFRDVMCEVGDL